MELRQYPEQMVFGLDIGTRNVVGTVGYMENENHFVVASQAQREHETRAMLDGQIHDINKVAQTIASIKKELEHNLGRKLSDVCIAAAGRVLKTVTVQVDYEFSNETTVNNEHIRSLELLGVEKAYEQIRGDIANAKLNFYCVGYTVVKYYLDDLPISNLEGHKASRISTQLLATFLPDDVIDGLYTAVERADLKVANLTLEPIAAINVAIPERFRLLNIALVDVGAGTSDICVTKDGSIIGYGMIPCAGDEITEVIMHQYLVEFNEAERIKVACFSEEETTYADILGISHTVSAQEVLKLVEPVVQSITKQVSDKICELNGDKPVSAVFVVGGGGKIPGFTACMAEQLGLPSERVALRGEEVLQQVQFLQTEIKKDPLLVTPIGICINYYDQKNNFIFVSVNGEMIKLYDNNKLTVVNAAMQIGFPNECLFPRRGREINYTVNGIKRVARGELGEAAVILVNGKEASISEKIQQNDIIEIVESTKGSDAVMEISQIPEYSNTIVVQFNGQTVTCPKYASVNGELVSEYYQIKDQDSIEILNYYTLDQLLQFMDIEYYGEIFINNKPADFSDQVYENFSVTCDLNSTGGISSSNNQPQSSQSIEEESLGTIGTEETSNHWVGGTEIIGQGDKETSVEGSSMMDNLSNDFVQEQAGTSIQVSVNGTVVRLTGKEKYVFVDLLDVYPFDVNEGFNKRLIMKVNEETAEFTTPIKDQDAITMIWKE